MDSSRKRKAQTLSATPTTSEGSATKKIKLLNSNPKPSADRSVLAIGTKLIAQLSNATDKTGRHITDAFLELPPRDELPDYYQLTGLPISIGIIEEKLRTNAYPSVSALESDFKRMIQNAKDYNEPRSEIYEDAERIRKLIYNYMKINNPAYQDSNYSAVPTPIPGGSTKITLTNGNRAHAAQSALSKPIARHTPTPTPVVKDEGTNKEDSSRLRLSLGPRTSEKAAEKHSEPPSDRKSSVAPSAADKADDESMDFSGKSFQEAQQMIVAEMIRYTDEEGLEIFTPFVYLPSRKLEDYYKYIKHPVSLKSVQKRIRGQHGREAPTGISDFKTWDAFEQEVSFIWRNARDYNEDGSDMYLLAGDLETHFKSRLAEAKEVVKEPQSMRIKLGGPQPPTKSGVTLNLSQHRASPGPSMAVDNDALARQRNMVMAGVNGSSSQLNPRPAAGLNGFARQSSQGPIRPPSSNQAGSPVKNEKLITMSPGPRMGAPAVQPTTNGMMPPPMMRAPSGTLYAAQAAPPVNSYSYTAPSLLPPTAIRQYPASEALLPLVTIHTHPQLKVPKPFSIGITPHASLSQQSATITLPHSHFFLQIQPTISRELAINRAYKIFVTMNGTRLTQRDTTYHQDSGKRTHSYDGNLAHGVNRIEIEVAAAKAGDNGDGKGLDIEKVTVYANLTRA